MRSTAFATFLVLTTSALAMPPVPRKAPEFTIVEPTGKEILLSSLKGKVVLMGFVATWCEHCQRFSQMVTKLQTELGHAVSRPVDVAFNPGDHPREIVTRFVRKFGIQFPTMGYASTDTVMSYLGISMMDRYVYPEVAIIDRKGVIRAQSPPQGDPNLQDEEVSSPAASAC